MSDPVRHAPDKYAPELSEHQYGRSIIEHEHVIVDDWPLRKKQAAAAHIDRLHGGRALDRDPLMDTP